MGKFEAFSAASLLFISTAAFADADTMAPPPPEGGPSVEQIFGFMDADKDGFITQAEAQGPMADHFTMMDANQDGKVSPAEMQAAMDMRAKMQGEGGAAKGSDTAH